MDSTAGFAESVMPGGHWMTYSDVLSADDTAAIDRTSYGRARTWYRSAAGDDRSLVDGISLGRAFELPATAMSIAYERSRLVLERLAAPGATVRLMGVGEEWALAAGDLGLVVDARSTLGRRFGAIVPDHGRREPSTRARLLARIAGIGAGRGDVALVETPRWGSTYQAAVARRWPVVAVNPGAHFLATAVSRGGRIGSRWIADAVPGLGGPALPAMARDGAASHITTAFHAHARMLVAWAGLGRRLGVAAAVASQDVTPSVRSVLLGIRASGGRIVTLEHGISGMYAEQVHTVADRLGVWGPIQAEYHVAAGPMGLHVVQLGWPRIDAQLASEPSFDRTDIDVLFFGQPTTPLSSGSWPEDSLAAHAIVEAYAERHPAKVVAVKHHPATTAYGSNAPSHRYAITVSDDSLALIRRARVVTAATSTTLLEAMALARPVVRIIGRGFSGPADLVAASDATATAASGPAFAGVVDRLLADDGAYRDAGERGRAYARTFIIPDAAPPGSDGRLIEALAGLLDP